MDKDLKDQRQIAYLLGQLPETERVQLEDQYFAEDARFEYLAAVETDLIDAYVRDELAAPDRVHFEQRFLGSPRLRARVAIAQQVQARALPPAGSSTRDQRREPRPAAARQSTPTLVGAVAAIVLVSAAVAGWWALQGSAPRAAAAQDAPAPNASEPVTPAVPAAPVVPAADRHEIASGPIALVLAPGSIGSREGSALLTIPAGADVVRLQVDHDGAACEKYAVLVTQERQRVWTELDMTARAPGAKGVILEIPVSSLPPGEYLLTLSGGAQKARRLEALADYSFRVRQ